MSRTLGDRVAAWRMGRWALVLTLVLGAGCAPEETRPALARGGNRGPEAMAPAAHRAHRAAARTPAERAAHIAAVQAGAGPEYAMTNFGGRIHARNQAQGFDVELGRAVVLQARPGHDDFRLSLRLAGYGCEGDVRSVTDAPPRVSGNRVEYVRRGSGAGDLVEWYVHGPLGLEQGFTLESPPKCQPATPGKRRDVAFDIDLDGNVIAAIAPTGNTIEFRDGSNRVVARYDNLRVLDTKGQDLPATLETTGSTIRIRFDDTAATYPVQVDPILNTQAELQSPGSSLLGHSVSLQSDTAVAGAPGAASVHVFARSGALWTHKNVFVPDNSAGASYGQSVSVRDDVCVAGAPWEDVDHLDSGAAYVYTRENDVWAQDAKLTPDSPSEGNNWGFSVAVGDDSILVGAPGNNNASPSAGAVYVFARANDVWEKSRLEPADGEIYDYFGTAVATAGNTIVIGSPYANSSGPGSGCAYVFTRDVGGWLQDAKLVPSDGAAGDQFGLEVSMSGDTVVVSSYAGAYVFVRSGPQWIEQAKLISSDGVPYDYYSVSVYGDVAALGDRDYDNYTGAIYLWHRAGGLWTEQDRYVAWDGFEGDFFGRSVALSSDSMIVGAPDHGVTEQGAAYVYLVLADNGVPCATGSDCASSFCADGICCAAKCDAGPCDACSVAAGAANDGVCDLLTGPPCTDGNACTQVDTCVAGICIGANPVLCPPADDCHDACDPATGLCTAVEKPNGIACNDSDACTLSDACQSGVCVGANPVVCVAPDACHEVGSCDPATGSCDSSARPDGTACNDSDGCTLSDACQSGVCVGANPVVCAAPDACHEGGSCESAMGSCDSPAKADGTACNDSDACTLSDACQSGMCAGANPVVCAPPGECHEPGSCDPSTGACDNPSKPDGTTCSLGACQRGQCQPEAAAGVGGGGGSNGGAGGGGSDGQTPEGAPLYASGGCACDAGLSQTPLSWPWLLLGALGATTLRSRRRRSSVRFGATGDRLAR